MDPAQDPAALRREHDEIAERIAARRSIDLVRRAAYTGFTAVVASGLAVKLAYDRWVSTKATRFTGPPVYFIVAAVVGSVLATLAVVWLVRARRIMRAEDALYERLRALRERLGLDP